MSIQVYKEEKSMYALAYQSEKVSEIPKLTMLSEIQKIIQLAYQRKGQEVKQEDLGFQSADLLLSISNNFKFIRIDELRAAFEKGVLGEYGEFFGLNSVTYHKWIKSYMEREERGKEILKLSEAKEPECTPEKLLEIKKQNVRKLFENVKKTGSCYDVFNSAYDFLNGLGFIKYSPKEKWAFFEQAQKKLIEQAELKRSTCGLINRLEVQKMLESLKKGNNGESKEKSRIQSEAKNMLLIDFFKNKVADLEELELILEAT